MKLNGWAMRATVAGAVLALGAGMARGPEAGVRRQVKLTANPDFSAGEQDVRVDGRAAAAEMGSAVAFGDVNGDGRQDLLMGERADNRVYIYFGRESLDPTDVSSDPNKAYVVTPDASVVTDVDRPDVTITCSGCSTDAKFGFSIATGLVDGDNISEIIIGAPFDDFMATDSGRAFILRGRAVWPATVDASTDANTFEIRSSSPNSASYFLGFAVSAGDADGDGRAEIAVSSRNANFPLYASSPTESQTGAVHLIDPGGSLSGDIDVATSASVRHIVGLQTGDTLGEHMTFCNVNGDVNGPNQIQDLVVGAIGVDNGSSAVDAGAMYVIRGDTFYDPNFPTGIPSNPVNEVRADPAPGNGLAVRPFRVLGADKEDSLGFAVACADINGDGLDDPASGAFFADGQGNNKSQGGEAYVFYGNALDPNNLNTNLRMTRADLTIFPSTAGDQLGFSLTTADMDCDGVPDLLVGARKYDPQDDLDPNIVKFNAGITYVIRGSARPSPAVLDLSKGTFNPNNPGVRPAPFRNYPSTRNDGDPNLPACDPANPDDPNDPCAVIDIIMGDISHQETGFSSAGGDFNGDACGEVAIGAIGDPTAPGFGSFKGRAYMVNLTDNDNDFVSDLSDQDDDNDCLSDVDETNNTGTDPLKPDTDGDGLQDGTELGVGADPGFRGTFLLYDPSDPNFSGSNPPDCSVNDPNAPLCCLDFDAGATTTDPLNPDTDSDSLPDGVDPNNPALGEDFDLNGHLCGDTNKDGTVAGSSEILCETNPNEADTDGDGLDDGAETLGGCPNPLDADSDDDGLSDGTGESAHGTDPCKIDTDGDGLQDGTEVGVTTLVPGPNGQDDTAAGQDGTDPNVIIFDADPNTTTDPTDQDTDDDCLPDGCIGACTPLPLGAPVLQGEDVNLNGKVDGTIILSGTGAPAVGTETDPSNPDSDGDGLPDGLEWGVTAAACAALSPPTPSAGKVDADSGATFTDPRDFDTDDGGVSDGNEDTSAGSGATHNGRRDFNPSTFVCDPNSTLLDTDNETNPNDATDDRGVGYMRPSAGPTFFAQDPNAPSATALTTYIQNDLLVVVLKDMAENKSPTARDTITLDPSRLLDPNNPNDKQGLLCLSDDPNSAVPVDAERLDLNEVDPNTGMPALDTGFFMGTLPMSTLSGGTGTLNLCDENHQVKLGFRDDVNDLCDQRRLFADVTLSQVKSIAPGLQSVRSGSITAIDSIFNEDLSCASFNTDPNSGNFRVSGTAGPVAVNGTTPLTCQVDPGQSAFKNREAILNLAGALPDDLYTVTMVCNPTTGIEDRQGFPADCETPCVLPASGNPPGYCAGVLSGDGNAGGVFTSRFIVDQTPPTVTGEVPASGSVLTTAPTLITVTFSQAIDPNTVDASSFVVSGTSTAVSCTYTYDPAAKAATCAIVSPATLPDDLYTVTLVGDPNPSNPSIRDYAGFPTGQGNPLNGGSSTVFTFVVDMDHAPAITATDPNFAQVLNTSQPFYSVSFEEGMDANTIDPNTFRISGTAGDITSMGTFSYNGPSKTETWSLDPNQLLPDDVYQVTLVGDPNSGAQSIRDFAGNALDGELDPNSFPPTGDGTMGGNFAMTFTVDAAVPVVNSTSPSCGTTSGTTLSTVSAVFSEQMNPSTLNPATVRIVDDGDPNIIFNTDPNSVVYDPNTHSVTIIPDFPLSSGTYQIVMDANVPGTDPADLTGNLLDGEFSGTFPSGDGTAGGQFVCPIAVSTGTFTVTAVDPPNDMVVLDPNGNPTNVLPTDNKGIRRVRARVSEKPKLTPTSTVNANTYIFRGSDPNAAPITCSYTFNNQNDPNTSQCVKCNMRCENSGTFPDDEYTVTLKSDPNNSALQVQPASNSSTNFLDGEFFGAFPSGNGTPGGDFVYHFFFDTDPVPSVTAMAPTAGSTSMTALSTVAVTFDQRMDPNTLDPNSFRVVGASVGAVTGTVGYDFTTNTATFTKASPFADDTYTVTLVGDPNTGATLVRDFSAPMGNVLDGDSSGTAGGDFVATFTVAVPPHVAAMSPSPSVGTADRSAVISLTFDDDMDQASVENASNWTVTDPNGSAVTASSIAYDGPSKTVTFTPSVQLFDGTYSVTLSASVTDTSSIALDGEFAGTFPSGDGTAGGDFTATFLAGIPPRVTAMAPAPGSSGMDPNVAIVLTFDEAMTQAQVEDPNNWTVSDTGGAVTASSISYNTGTNQVTFTPTSPLNDGNVSVTLSGSVQDVAGNDLDGDFSGAFPSGNGTPGGAFTATFAVDTTGPRVAAMLPAPGSPTGDPNAAIVLTFDEDMNQASVENAANWTLTDPNGASVTASSIVYSSGAKTATFTPSVQLFAGTYSVTLSASATDVAGNALDGEFSGTFPSGDGSPGGNFSATFVVDLTAPRVTAMSPDPNIPTMDPNAAIVLTFDKEMNQASVENAANWMVTDPNGTAVTASSIVYSSGAKTATFTPSVQLFDGTYSVTLSAAATDLAGNALDGEFGGTFPSGDGSAGGSFTATFGVDLTPPRVTAMSPDPNLPTMDPNAVIVLTFDEDMAQASVENAANWTVTDPNGTAVTASSIVYSSGAKTATFTPSVQLFGGTYNVTLSAAATDVAGNALDGEFSGTFPTGDGSAGGNFTAAFGVDLTAPTVTAMSPDPSTGTMDPNAAIVLTFDENMNQASVENAANWTVTDPNGASVTAASIVYSSGAKTATFTPSVQLFDGTYSVTLSAAATDLAGNALDGEFGGTFPSGDGSAGGNFTATFTVSGVPLPPPPSTPVLEVDGGGAVNWTSQAAPSGGSTPTYNLYRGDLGVLVTGGSYTQDPSQVPDAMAMCGLTGSSYDDGFAPPAPGVVVFYLVTEVVDGVEGTLGYDSSGNQRTNDGLCTSGTTTTISDTTISGTTTQGGSSNPKNAELRPAGGL